MVQALTGNEFHQNTAMKGVVSDAEPLQLRAANFCMAQSRKRLFILMVRNDVADAEVTNNLASIIKQVLPHAMHLNSGSAGAQRETLHEHKAYVTRVLGLLGKIPTVPDIAKDRFATPPHASFRVATLVTGPCQVLLWALI